MVVDNQLIQTSRKPSKEGRLNDDSQSKLTIQELSPQRASNQESFNRFSSNQVSQFIPIGSFRGNTKLAKDGVIVSTSRHSYQMSKQEKPKSTESIRRQKLRFIVEYAHQKQIENQKIILNKRKRNVLNSYRQSIENIQVDSSL